MTLFLRCLTLLLVACSLSFGVQAKKSYSFEHYDVAIYVQEDGSFRVKESLTYRFSGGTFSYAYRNIWLRRSGAITDVRVSSPDVEIQEVSEKKQSEKYRIKWEFLPHQGTATFHLSYTVAGALLTRDGQQSVYWKAVGKAIDVPVEALEVAVHLPFEALPAGDIQAAPAEEVRMQHSDTGHVLTFAYQNLPPEAGYAVKVDFPQQLDLPDSPDYEAEERSFEQKLLLMLFLPLSGIVVGVIVLAWGPRVSHKEITQPPKPDLPIAEAGFLLLEEDTTRMRIYTAMLFELAKRGYLQLWQDTPPDKKKAVLKADVKPEREGLSVLESRFLDQLAAYPDIKTFFKKTEKFRTAQLPELRKKMLERNFCISLKPRANTLLIAGLIALLPFFLSMLFMHGMTAGLVGGGSGALAFGLVLAGLKRYRLTPEGAQKKAEIKAYVKMLHKRLNEERKADPVRAVATLLENLPWLMYDLRLSQTWLHVLKRKLRHTDSQVTLPDWLTLADEDANEDFIGVFVVMSFMTTNVVGTGGAVAGMAGAGAAAAGAAGGGGAGAG